MMTDRIAKPRPKGPSRSGKPHAARALGDSTIAPRIRFSATLLRPRQEATTAHAVTWTFLTLPSPTSAKLPSRGMMSVEGTFNGLAFQATLQPDGHGGHWLKVDQELRQAAGAHPGDRITLEISPVAQEPEPSVPDDLRQALASAHPKARAVWSDITPVA
ncbi:MAG TPA: DUF1905 domain-containing protein, partial [Phycisphaerae bacterium]